ncbi:MAG TPA: hypothetical protein VK165_00955 [Azonexus sp.]|nr:hypothetical protein [Azonexus sp.]
MATRMIGIPDIAFAGAQNDIHAAFRQADVPQIVTQEGKAIGESPACFVGN